MKLCTNMKRFFKNQQGVSTVLVTCILAVIVVLGTIIASLANVVMTKTRLRTASDRAAVSAAERIMIYSLDACETARMAAEENGAELKECKVEDFDVTVKTAMRSSVPLAGEMSASARAGPVDCE